MSKITSKSISSNQNIVLNKKPLIGRTEYINSIIPLAVKCNPNVSVSSIHKTEENKCNPIKENNEQENQPAYQSTLIREEKIKAVPNGTKEHQQKILGSIDLSILTSKQKEMVMQVIKEECDVLSKDGDNVGDTEVIQ